MSPFVRVFYFGNHIALGRIGDIELRICHKVSHLGLCGDVVTGYDDFFRPIG